MIVACVLKSGGRYRPEHVLELRDSVERHLPGARFVCLSDVEVPGVERKPLLWDLPGWWSKLELFSPGVHQGTVMYIDLDTVVVGSLAEMAAYQGECAILRDFYSPATMIGSGVVIWRAGAMQPVWDAFKADPEGILRSHPTRMDRFIIKHLPESDRIQDVFPGQAVSYKAHCQEGIPPGARLVCFHGDPKPWDLSPRLDPGITSLCQAS